MKRIFLALILSLFLAFAGENEIQNPQKTRIYFSPNIVPQNPQCVEIFVNMVKESFDCGYWCADEGKEWFKEYVSFEFDTWDNDKILVKLFFDWADKDSKEFQGTGTITWLEYDIDTQKLKDSVQEKDLVINVNLVNKFNDCLKYCHFAQTSALQNQYKYLNVDFLMQNEIIGTHAKERAYFYSAPHKNCKIDDLFLIPKDELDLLQNKGEFSFVAYKRQNGEFIKLWLKSDRIR